MRYNVRTFLIEIFPVMPLKKSANLNLRIDPILKEAVREAALREHRSVTNMIEVLIRQHCSKIGIPIPEQRGLFEQDDGE